MQVYLTGDDGSLTMWGTGIVPVFKDVLNDMKVESGEYVIDSDDRHRRRKGAPVVFAATDDAAKHQQVPLHGESQV
jgi:hypothetical protein